MLKLSKKADYAIVALSHLSNADRPASAREIAQSYNLSLQMLANVLKTLASAGLLSSKRGVTGGYSLSLNPAQISMGQVIEIIDGKLLFSDCSHISRECDAAGNCPAKGPMIMINKKIKHFFDHLSLADITDKEQVRNMTLG